MNARTMNARIHVVTAALCAALLCAYTVPAAQAQTTNPQLPQAQGVQSSRAAPGRVVASGTVPDEATRVTVLTRLRELYGSDNVVDQITVGGVVAPANWANYVQKMLTPNLKQVSRGQLAISGNRIELSGEVSNEAMRQQVASDIASQLNSTYTVRNGLRVSSADQAVLDNTLGNRIVEFDPGSAQLTPRGVAVLDEMADAIARLGAKRVEVVGHTDSDGPRMSNIALSIARAEAVRTYLITKGIAPNLISTSGAGPDRPVASNATQEGRARNRRIEFRLSQ